MDGWTERQTDKVITIGPPQTSSGGTLINFQETKLSKLIKSN